MCNSEKRLQLALSSQWQLWWFFQWPVLRSRAKLFDVTSRNTIWINVALTSVQASKWKPFQTIQVQLNFVYRTTLYSKHEIQILRTSSICRSLCTGKSSHHCLSTSFSMFLTTQRKQMRRLRVVSLLKPDLLVCNTTKLKYVTTDIVCTSTCSATTVSAHLSPFSWLTRGSRWEDYELSHCSTQTLLSIDNRQLYCIKRLINIT